MNQMTSYDNEIDATLRLLGRSQPSAGLSDRIMCRLANKNPRTQARPRSGWQFAVVLRMAAGSLAASLCAAAIVLGTVEHSRRIVVVAPPVRVAAPGGFGAAGAEHVATKPTTPPSALSGRNMRHARQGRAVVAPDAHKAPGVALPKPPEQ